MNLRTFTFIHQLAWLFSSHSLSSSSSTLPMRSPPRAIPSVPRSGHPGSTRDTGTSGVLSINQSPGINPLSQSGLTGAQSIRPYRNGYFGTSIKLQSGYTAGVNTAFYLSNNEAHPGFHDEVDIEFLGTTPGKPYTLQTNVYVRGSGDGRVIGREMRFHLWFDPTAAFHHYAILWNPDEIIFFVDDVPIRRYARKIEATFPDRPMWVYGSIWDASSWATENGKYKADYRFQPFVARFTDFKITGCSANAPSSCRPVPASPSGYGLSARQYAAMQWAQRNHMVYDYCHDYSRDHSLTPEC
ncbi:xyloglucan endotransglucosylase/hydrolase protein 31 isoform X2 [Musa acuminata AAA Group]|uniref:xyloglucan endotransglucosylase/hydrolase protein 31 isoform X2 n=1 Tax=Musa acuminata AAA Group TaxID=214697 RepID=UPI0031D0A996